MSEKLYQEIRGLLLDKKDQQAKKLIKRSRESSENYSVEQKYWYYLIENYYARNQKDSELSYSFLLKASQIMPKITLNEHQKGSFHGQLGTTLQQLERYEEALREYEKAHSSVKSDLKRRNHYRRSMIYCYYKIGDLKRSFEFIYNILASNFAETTINEWDANLAFSWDLINFASDLKWFDLIINVLNTIKLSETEILGRSHRNFLFALLHRQQMNREAFKEYMELSLTLCPKLPLEFILNLRSNFIMLLENPFGEFERTKELLQQNLQDVKKPSPLQIVYLNRLGSCLRFIGQYEKALKVLEEALKINTENFQYKWQESFSHNTMGMIFTLMGKSDQALSHYTKSLVICEEIDDFYGMGFTYGAIGWLESIKGDLEKALESYKSAFNSFNKIDYSIPPVILLAYSEILSRQLPRDPSIEENLEKARNQIWQKQRRLDIARYYNTLGNIALNYKQLDMAEKEFSLALEYSDSFEVETQTLLGIIKVNLEQFIQLDSEEHLKKAELFLNDLKTASKNSLFISGEMDLILGIINMYYQNFGRAEEIFSHVFQHARSYGFNSLLNRVEKQKKVLNILNTHKQIETILEGSYSKNDLKSSSIREAIAYLNELGNLLGSHIRKNGDKES